MEDPELYVAVTSYAGINGSHTKAVVMTHADDPAAKAWGALPSFGGKAEKLPATKE